MYVVIVDIAAILLIACGIALVVRRPGGAGANDPRTYARRIAGTMT